LAKLNSQILLFSHFVKKKTALKKEVHNSLVILQNKASPRAFLNHHLESHLHKNRFLYFFLLSSSFAKSHAHSRESFSSFIFG